MAKKKAVPEENTGVSFTPDYASILKGVERKFKLTSSSTDIAARRQTAISTGLLATDLIIGGGLLPGWSTVFGGEQSCKSTFKQHVAISSVEHEVPLILDFDYEGSGDPQYFGSTLETMTMGKLKVDDIFGLYGGKGEIIKAPRIRLYNETVGESFFDSMASMLRQMPDKVFEDGEWFYVYENTNENRKTVGSNYSKSKFSEWNKFYVPTGSSKPQAVLMVDSYPYMYPEMLDEDDKGAGMAAVARMFSSNIPKLAPKLKKKCVVVLGVNQLRQRPAARGDPFYEPAGEAIRFASQLRLRSTSRAIPHGTGQIEEEDSATVDGGRDTYRYIVQRATKNKTGGMPLAEVWQRVWVSDAEGKAHGIDPVWDTYQYLKLTGQVEGSLKKLKFKVPGLPEKMQWWDFKALMLLRGKELKEHCDSIGITRNPKVREFCKKQLESGEAFTKYIETRQGLGDEGGEDESE